MNREITVVDEATAIARSLTPKGRSQARCFRLYAYAVVLEYDIRVSSLLNLAGNLKSHPADRFLTKLRSAMCPYGEMMAAEVGVVRPWGDKVRQTIVFVTGPDCDSHFWQGFPVPPKNASAGIKWSGPITIADLAYMAE